MRSERVSWLAMLVVILALPPFIAQAQVMEIGENGRVTIYDGPAIFEVTGARPIQQETVLRRAGGKQTTSFSTILDAASASQLSPDLVEAVAWRELRSRAGLVSRSGAIGEMQLMPATARSLGVDPYNSIQNYEGGAAYLSALLRRYDNDLVLALAAYNAGPGAVDRYRGVPPYKETRDYVGAVLDRLSQRAITIVPVVSER